MTHSFSRVPQAQIPRSTFDRSHGYKTTFNAGLIIPILMDEALPGDSISCTMYGFSRLATPINPLMDNMRMETFFFAVPKRLIWDNWQKFNGEQVNPGDSTDFTIPQIVSPAGSGYAELSLEDYFGLPTKVPSMSHSSLWHRAYNLIYNEWFRDQNLQNSVPVPKNDGPDNNADFKLLRRGKRHDYFTACLPWPQKGDAVQLPLGTTAPVGLIDGTGASGQDMTWQDFNSGDIRKMGHTSGSFVTATSTAGSGSYLLHADLANATAATINTLRQAFQIQRLLERDARGGTRYTEIVRAHFGVISPDARLQRPEYLGGGSSGVNINPVAQTSSTDTTTPQGNLSAFGTAAPAGHGFTKSFTEHCVILGFVNVRADLTYQQGLDRMFSRKTRYDFYWPALAHIGEQAVLNKEIFAQGTTADDDVFGYQERFAEYRYKTSKVTGLFRSNAAQPLDTWHLSQKFDNLPTLGDAFIEDNPPIDRVIAVQNEPHFLFDAWFQYRCARPMPVFGVPGMIDHF